MSKVERALWKEMLEKSFAPVDWFEFDETDRPHTEDGNDADTDAKPQPVVQSWRDTGRSVC